MACLHPIVKRGKTVYRLVARKNNKIYFTKTFHTFEEGESFLRQNPQYGTLRCWNKELSLGIRPKIGAKGAKFFSFHIEHEIKGDFHCCFTDYKTAVQFRDLVWDKYKKDPEYLRKDLRVDCTYFKLNGQLLNVQDSSETEILKMQMEVLEEQIKELENIISKMGH